MKIIAHMYGSTKSTKFVEYKDDTSMEDMMTEWGYNKYPSTHFGVKDHFIVEVYEALDKTKSDEYVVYLGFGFGGEFFFVDTLLHLIELLGKLTPIADVALRQSKYDDEEQHAMQEAMQKAKLRSGKT